MNPTLETLKDAQKVLFYIVICVDKQGNPYFAKYDTYEDAADAAATVAAETGNAAHILKSIHSIYIEQNIMSVEHRKAKKEDADREAWFK